MGVQQHHWETTLDSKFMSLKHLKASWRQNSLTKNPYLKYDLIYEVLRERNLKKPRRNLENHLRNFLFFFHEFGSLFFLRLFSGFSRVFVCV